MGSRKQIKKIAILGTSGMLGYASEQYFKSIGVEVVSIDRKIYDVLSGDINILKNLINSCDFVINCIGIIKPRISSMKVEDVFIVNGTFPKNLAKLSKSMDIPCFHITTDCVYSGSKGNYNENDLFDITDLYGLSKNAGENSECMTLRTSIIGEEKNNKYSLVEWAISQKNKRVTGFKNHIWNGVTTLYLAQLIENIYTLGLYKEGVYHLFSQEPVTKYELLKIISKAYNLNLDIEETDAPVAVDRSLASVNKISNRVVTESIQVQVEKMYSFFSTHIS